MGQQCSFYICLSLLLYSKFCCTIWLMNLSQFLSSKHKLPIVHKHKIYKKKKVFLLGSHFKLIQCLCYKWIEQYIYVLNFRTLFFFLISNPASHLDRSSLLTTECYSHPNQPSWIKIRLKRQLVHIYLNSHDTS